MIFARRSRSASACRAIARCIPCGISTSLTSTIETLIPQGAVCSSMISCRIVLIFSRSDRSSSSWCWPSTDLSVVCEICDVATMKFSICTIAAFGSTIRKYATAFTRTGTLSLVMTSCGGMLSVIVRRSTFTIRSTIGISRNSPGPFGCGSSRPSRKTIPRSYSRATLIADTRNRTAKNRMIAATIRYSMPRILESAHGEREALDRLDPDALARGERCGGARAPQLAVHEDEARLAGDSLHPDDLLGADGHRAPSYLDRLRQRENPEAADHERDREDERNRRLVRRRRLVEQRREPDPERDQAGDGEGAVADDVRFEHEQADAEHDEREPRPRQRQDRESEQRREERDGAKSAGEDDAGVEDLVPDACDAGQEEEADEVRVDQRGQEACHEPGLDVGDLSVRG